MVTQTSIFLFIDNSRTSTWWTWYHLALYIDQRRSLDLESFHHLPFIVRRHTRSLCSKTSPLFYGGDVGYFSVNGLSLFRVIVIRGFPRRPTKTHRQILPLSLSLSLASLHLARPMNTKSREKREKSSRELFSMERWLGPATRGIRRWERSLSLFSSVSLSISLHPHIAHGLAFSSISFHRCRLRFKVHPWVVNNTDVSRCGRKGWSDDRWRPLI